MIRYSIEPPPGIPVLIRLLALEDVHDGPGDDADVIGVLLHGEGLARPSLTVGHYRGVVALQHSLIACERKRD